MALNIKDLRITCDAFAHGEAMDDRFSKYHDNDVPPLRFSGVPDGTRSLALICHDPDAPLPHGWTHWVVYGIAAGSSGVQDGTLAGTQGRTDFGEQGWGGPMPPPGHGTHHYYFWLYALDIDVTDGPGLSRAELLERIQDHVIEQARIVGTYQK